MDDMKGVGVVYKYIDGMHFFVAADKAAAGLCVAHEDLTTAYHEVGEQLSALALFNHGKNIKFHPAVTVDVFKSITDAYASVTNLADTISSSHEVKGLVTAAAIQQWLQNFVYERQKEVA